MKLTINKAQIITAAILLMLGGAAITTTQLTNLNFQNVIYGKDIVADILPPPMYIIETQLLLSNAMLTGNFNKENYSKLKNEYLVRQQYWEKQEIPLGVKDSLKKQTITAINYFNFVEKEFIPSLDKKDYKLYEKLLSVFSEHRKSVEETVKTATSYADKNNEEYLKISDLMNKFNLMATIMGLLVIAFITVPSFFRIKKSLSQLNFNIDALERGNLKVEIKDSPSVEMKDLTIKLESMRVSLHKMIGDMNDNAKSLTKVTEEINSKSTNFESTSEEQYKIASSLAEAIEEMVNSINQIKEQTNIAKLKSMNAGNSSELGNQSMIEVSDGVQQISKTVNITSIVIMSLENEINEINTILGSIKDIASQTNLLALNAAIEAARAGESGRGFAVVADEVRKLSEKTSSSTEAISGLIEKINLGMKSSVDNINESLIQVDNGIKKANDAMKIVNKITEENKEVILAVTNINDSVLGQVETTNQITEKVDELKNIADGSKNSAKETREIANNVKENTDRINKSIGSFKI